ncbi:hypothetical protein C9E81_06985 [Paracoccus alkanivorans]|uniref:Uncharacterized protein n=1 Tax=Paracoccus alkanivorans TaxID=2116655 RepID=A0A3M0MJG3_9RHOB|nr:hypothetical protein C9E81_06985 [Paracoccus alkanivorans]
MTVRIEDVNRIIEDMIRDSRNPVPFLSDLARYRRWRRAGRAGRPATVGQRVFGFRVGLFARGSIRLRGRID